MMHDKNGTQLQVGDIVNIPCEVTDVQAGSDYCNVSLKSLHGRRPDGSKESYCCNTGVVVLVDRSEVLKDNLDEEACEACQ